ncbi:MAG: Na+/H+ antiporter subunit E [Dehalococcoidales bacterium]|nr:Na+/H+ antiporter subunit E [Dehalococcoidales bacterium]MDD4230146.1 Na+/H+ antiporter subunit E [Dehalococcoidales bacterium]
MSSVLQFIPLYAFWLVLSEHYQPFYLISGALICALIVLFNNEMFSSLLPADRKGALTIFSAIRTAYHLIKYIPWLIIQIARDNLLVAYLVIHPKMPIDPRLLGFKTGYRRSASQVILANSITLSPGTMTILLENNHYLVHALVPSSCNNLTSGETQGRVGKIFDEAPETPPEAVSGYTFKEIE